MSRVLNKDLWFPFPFLSNPLETFAIWHGGMSFHGGPLGALFVRLPLGLTRID
ncbi:MAG: prolipoprotein diacylglyceryl transferase family protein [Candidatus Binatia bacterium]